MRKQSGPPELCSRKNFFSSLKLGIPANNFSAGNASDEPLSAASFSANGIGNNSPGPNNLLDAAYDAIYDQPETLTPTLPSGSDSSPANHRDFQADLDKELLGIEVDNNET